MFELCCVLSLLTFIPSHPCFVALCLIHFLTILYTVSYTCTQSDDYSFACYIFRRVQPLPLCKEGHSLAAWLNNPVSQVLSPSLSSKSAASTPRSTHLRERDSLDTNLDDLATTVDASERIDTTDVQRLTSPLFSQEREVSATPVGVSCSQTQTSVGRPTRDTDLFSSIGRERSETLSLFQVSRNQRSKKSRIWTVCNFVKWKRKEFCLNRKSFMNSLKRKLIELFKDNLRLKQDYLNRRPNWPEESGKGEMLIFVKVVDSSNPRGWEKRAGYVKNWT